MIGKIMQKSKNVEQSSTLLDSTNGRFCAVAYASPSVFSFHTLTVPSSEQEASTPGCLGFQLTPLMSVVCACSTVHSRVKRGSFGDPADEGSCRHNIAHIGSTLDYKGSLKCITRCMPTSWNILMLSSPHAVAMKPSFDLKCTEQLSFTHVHTYVYAQCECKHVVAHHATS